MKYNSYTSRITKRGHSMNELELTNIQALLSSVVLIGLLVYLNHQDRKKSVQIERESKQTIETPIEDLSPCYGRYIQLAGVRPWGC